MKTEDLLARFLKTGTLPTGARLVQLDNTFCRFEVGSRRDIVRRERGRWVDVDASHKKYLLSKNKAAT